jgi:hypothetical protein
MFKTTDYFIGAGPFELRREHGIRIPFLPEYSRISAREEDVEGFTTALHHSHLLHVGKIHRKTANDAICFDSIKTNIEHKE